MISIPAAKTLVGMQEENPLVRPTIILGLQLAVNGWRLTVSGWTPPSLRMRATTGHRRTDKLITAN
jgi:hypothetical protein